MKNWEFYEQELSAYGFSFAMSNNRLCNCRETLCNNCAFCLDRPYSCDSCEGNKIRWLYQEYKEPVILTEDEKLLCKLLGRGWIARDKDDCLHWHERKPYKGDCTWIRTRQSKCVNIRDIFPQCKFEFIKWEDEKPWEVKVSD